MRPAVRLPSSSAEPLAKKAKKEKTRAAKKLTEGTVFALLQGASTCADLGFRPVMRLVSIAALPETTLLVARYTATFFDGMDVCNAIVRSHLTWLVDDGLLVPGAVVRINKFSVNNRDDKNVLIMLEDVRVLAPP